MVTSYDYLVVVIFLKTIIFKYKKRAIKSNDCGAVTCPFFVALDESSNSRDAKKERMLFCQLITIKPQKNHDKKKDLNYKSYWICKGDP